ncbi:hypothetical protein PIB30_041828 [Stylosanthes scabra]|uniref:Uncharacterized protein n=1 Tax=Stylosanthes scabra TaxID=79078 RepID=A0ABU6QEN7_9FABA|nr:hypothetical protein [Stylosanthes scabra]
MLKEKLDRDDGTGRQSDNQKRPCCVYRCGLVMRRQGARYGDPSGNTYVAAQMHHHVGGGQRIETKPDDFEGRLEAFTPERENPYVNSKPEGQWRWEVDESKMSNSMASRMYNEGKIYLPPFYLLYSYAYSHTLSFVNPAKCCFWIEKNSVVQTLEALLVDTNIVNF